MDDVNNDRETARLLSRAIEGDGDAWQRLLTQHHERLRRMVAVRLDVRVRGRIDPSDIIQEARLDAIRRIGEYVASPSVPFFVWLRFLTAQRLAEQHRRHLGTDARDIDREARLGKSGMVATSAIGLAECLVESDPTPCEVAIREERRRRLTDAFGKLDAEDREVLALRHYEQLSNNELAAELGVDPSAASKRHARALIRLRKVLDGLPGGLEGIAP